MKLQDGEKWFAGSEGIYSVTEGGEVFTYYSGVKTLMVGGVTYQTGQKDKSTYKVVCLQVNGKPKTFYIHRMVAFTFLPNPENLPCVNHMDGNKLNNSFENLEWCTHKHNAQHAWDTGLRTPKTGYTAKTSDMISKSLDVDLSEKASYYIKKRIPKEMFDTNGIPPEIAKAKCTKVSFIENWNYYIDLFSLCDSSFSLREVAAVIGMDTSAISLIRSGKRLKKARVIYDKYKDNPDYFKSYQPCCDYPDDIKSKIQIDSLYQNQIPNR